MPTLGTVLLLLVIVPVTCLSGCALLGTTPTITQHQDSLVVMNIDLADQTKRVSDRRAVSRIARICREFYRHYEDAFDILIVVSNRLDNNLRYWGLQDSLGAMVVVRNTEKGTGVAVYRQGKRFGSKSRLRGVMVLPHAESLILGYALHEIMHLWVRDREVIPTTVDGHWGFSSVNGQLGGFNKELLVSLGDGKYSAGEFWPQADFSNSRPFSELELYLAGWLPSEMVPDILVAEDAKWSYWTLTMEEYEACKLSRASIKYDPHWCFVEKDASGNKVFTASEFSTWTIDQIIERLGPRVPDTENSQKSFRIAVIVVGSNQQPVTGIDTVEASLYIEQFTAPNSVPKWFGETLSGDEDSPINLINFWEATGGRATLQAGDLQAFRKLPLDNKREF